MRRFQAFLLVLLLAAPLGAAAPGQNRAAAKAAWTAFLPSPAARPLLGSLGLERLNPAHFSVLAGVLSEAGVAPAELAALPEAASQARLVFEKAEVHAAALVAAGAPAEAVSAILLAALAPRHAAEVRKLAEVRIEEARRAWEDPAAAAPVAGAESTTRAVLLGRAAAAMEKRISAGRGLNEDQYRLADAATLFPADQAPRRMDTLLSRQAADPAQAMLEVIANAQDAGASGKKVGRFGVGGLQVLGELKGPGDRVVMETSKGDGRGARFEFWRKDGEVYFDWRELKISRRGTIFRVKKELGAEEAARRKEFLERKLRANDRGPILWVSGGALNAPETFREWGGARAAASAPPVRVALSASGYEVEDSGVGMGLKEVFERYLKPYSSDKPVKATKEAARLFWRDAPGGARASLGVTTVEIERLDLAARGRRLNMPGDLFIDLPHDTELTEDRGQVALVNADQSVGAALRGLKLLIDRLTDPKQGGPERFALINALAAVIREKQPAGERGMTRGDGAEATDLMWYLRRRLEGSGLLTAMRREGTAFLPNAPRWAPLEGISDKIIFLDEDLFSPTMADYSAAGFEALPAVLTTHPAWRAFAARYKGVVFYARLLRQDRGAAVVDGKIAVIDKGVLARLTDPEVLVARLERELAPPAAAPPARSKSSGLFARVLRPLVLVAALAAAPVAYFNWPSGGPAQAGQEWSAYFDARFENSGNWGRRDGGAGDAESPANPSRPFGRITPAGAGDPHFVAAVRSRLSDKGYWEAGEAPWTQAREPSILGEAEAPVLSVSYRLALSPRHPARLFNQIDGRISSVSLKDSRGRDIAFEFDELTDELRIPDPQGFTGAATVSYSIKRSGRVNALSDDEGVDAPLPANELRDFPRQWAFELVRVRNGSDAEKIAAIETIMARDFTYDYNKPFLRGPLSWGHSAGVYLDRGEPVPTICNTSSLYYYLMARYLGLPAAYVTLVNTEGGTFYHDLMGHAKVLVKVDGKWRFIETTEFMPLVSAPPRVLPGAPSRSKDDSFWEKYLAKAARPAADGLDEIGSSLGLSRKTEKWIMLGVIAFGSALLTALLGYAVLKLLRARRAIRPLLQSWSAFASGLERFPGRWLWWKGYASAAIRLAGPWGAAYRQPTMPNTIFLADGHGAMRRIPLVAGQEPQTQGGVLLFVQNHWFGESLRVFDGKEFRTLYRSFWRSPKPLPPMGPRRYAVIGRRLVRLDLANGRLETVFELPRRGLQVAPLDSRGGVDRFAVVRTRWYSNRVEARVLSVSGLRAAWEGAETSARVDWSKVKKWSAAPSSAGAVIEFVVTRGKEETAVVVVAGRGIVSISGRVRGVLAGKIFFALPHNEVSKALSAYDPASGRGEPARLWDAAVEAVERLGENLFYAVVRDDAGRSFAVFSDADGDIVAPARRRPAAAVRHGDTVYYRPAGAPSVLAVAAKDAPERQFLFANSPLRQYSQAAARAAGLDAALLEPLDIGWEGVRAPLLASSGRGGLRQDAAPDEALVEGLEPGLRAAVPFRAAAMPAWSPARLFMSPEAAGLPMAPQVIARLDALARANAARPAWLREAFELVDRVYRHGIESAAAVAGHYLDLLEAMPEILPDLRQAMLEPAALPDGSRIEPLGYLNGYSQRRARELPAATHLYLQMLKEGPESLLRREVEGAPAGPPSFALPASGESLTRLIAAARAVSDEALDAGGLGMFARAYAALAPGESADLNAVRGVVMNQGAAAPVWIRELVQNARDAVREARRQGRAVAAKVALRSYLSQDGARWIVSVQDGVGMKLSRVLKALLIPEATTKTLADEVQGFLALGGTPEERVDRILSEFFDDAARQDGALRVFLETAAAQGGAAGAREIAAKLSERMRKGAAGFFGIGFFTVFAGADEVIVRTGAEGKLREAALVPVRDETGRLTDIRVRVLREWDDAGGSRAGTEILRVKKVTPENMGRVLVENAYVHIMAGKYLGAVSDIELTLNGESIQDELAVVGARGGLRSRLGLSARRRWTVDELFVQEPPAEGLSLIPAEARAALEASGWNLDFPAATAVVRTRASVQSPERYAQAAAALALPAAYELYKRGAVYLPGLPDYDQHRRVSPWDEPPLAAELLRDASAAASNAQPAGFWERYGQDARAWARLMLAVHDDKERVLRGILGPELSAALDALRARGEPLGVGTLPYEGAPRYAQAVRELHERALAKAGRFLADLQKEPAAAGLARVLSRLSEFMEDPPPFVAAGPAAWEGLRRLLDEGLAVPLMEALLESSGRTSDSAAVRLFEGWLKEAGAKKELETLFFQNLSREQVEASLSKLWKAAFAGRPALLPLTHTTQSAGPRE